MTAESEGSGRGTELTVRLPAGAMQPKTAASRSTLDVAATGHRERILVVDDKADNRAILGSFLRDLGFAVEEAADGAAAVAAASRTPPDAVFMDLVMPRMDGFEVARRLRERPEFEGLLLVALTGYGTSEDRRRSLGAGFDDHLVKPPGVEMLRALLAHPKLRVK